MCGIVGYSGKRSAQEVLLNGLEKLEYRGYDSAGVALALEGGIHVVKSKGTAGSAPPQAGGRKPARRASAASDTPAGPPTASPATSTAIPHSTPRVSIVHNGIIENYGPLKDRPGWPRAYTFESETDTEVLVKLIDYCCCAQPKQSPLAGPAGGAGAWCGAAMRWPCCSGITRTPSSPSRRRAPSSWAGARARTSWPPISRPCSSTPGDYSVLEEGDLAVVTAEGIRFYNAFGEPVEREVPDRRLGPGSGRKGRLPPLHAQGDQ